MKKIVYELIICLVTVTIFLVSGPVYAFQTVTQENQATEVSVPTSTKTGTVPLKNRKTAEPVATGTETVVASPEKQATQEPAPTNTAAVTALPEKQATKEPEPTNTAAVTTSPEKRATQEPEPINTATVTASPEKRATQEPEPTNTAVVTASPEKRATKEPEPTNTAAVTASSEKRATKEPVPTNTAAVTASPEKQATKEPEPTNTAAVTASPEKRATQEPEPTNTAVVTASPEITVTEEPVSVIDYVLSSDPESAPEPQHERPETPDAQYHQIFKFSQNIVIQGIFEKSGYFFKVQKYWDTVYALAQIEYTVSPLITDDVPASLTFFINDHPIYSCAVRYENGAPQIVYVEIPTEYLREGFNEFAITGYVRLYDDDECLDDFSGANWISISASSFIEAGYDLTDFGSKLSYYPYPLISSVNQTGADLTIFVPSGATEEELRSAFMMRADLGNETTTEDRIALQTLAHYGQRTGNALIIAQLDRLPQDAKEQYNALGEKFEEGAVVFEYEKDGGYVVVITAAKETDLIEGACMLMDENRVSQEKYNWAFVPSGSAQTVVRNSTLSALIENGETIKGITNQDGIDFIGPFHQETSIYLPFSGGFVLGEGGKVEIKMRYSDNLDFDRSLMTVYWGNTPVASKKLTQENADNDSFSFLMPSDVVGTHADTIRIAFDLEIQELYCTKRADQMPWAYVSGDSTFYLPAGMSSTYDLALRPYPFQVLGLFNNLAVVIPDEMSDTEYTLFGRLAALMGTNISPYGTMQVWFASHYPMETENANVILLGTWKDNTIIQKLNEYMSFKFNEDGTRFESNEQLLLSPRYAGEISILQIIRHPYQDGRAILVVSGADDKALSLVDRFCAVQANIWDLGGDAYIIDSDLETKSFRFLEALPEKELTLRERMEQNRDAVLFTLISTSAMLILFIGALLILLRYRRNVNEERKK